MSEALREFGPAIWVADGRDVSFFGNRLHHLFLAEWKSAYPKARLYASPSLRKKRKDLAFDAELSDRSDPEKATDIDQVAVRGSPLTEIEFFHRASRTAIFADLIQIDKRLVQGLGVVPLHGSTGRTCASKFRRSHANSARAFSIAARRLPLCKPFWPGRSIGC